MIKAPIFSFKEWKNHLRETRFKRGEKKPQSFSVALAGCTDVSCCSTLQWQQNRFQTWASLLENERSCLCSLSSTRCEGLLTIGSRLFGDVPPPGTHSNILTEGNYTPLSDFIDCDAISGSDAALGGPQHITCACLPGMLKDLQRVLFSNFSPSRW